MPCNLPKLLCIWLEGFNRIIRKDQNIYPDYSLPHNHVMVYRLYIMDVTYMFKSYNNVGIVTLYCVRFYTFYIFIHFILKLIGKWYNNTKTKKYNFRQLWFPYTYCTLTQGIPNLFTKDFLQKTRSCVNSVLLTSICHLFFTFLCSAFYFGSSLS